MAINAVSIHRFQVNDDVTQIFPSPSSHEVNSLSLDVCQELKLAFIGKAGKQFGHFSTDIGACPLPAWLMDYLESRQTFHKVSERFAEHLQLQFAQADAVFDGYLLMFHETLADEDSVFAYLVQHEGGVFVDVNLHLMASKNLDVRGLRCGVKVSLHAWQAQSGEPYLSQLRARGDKPLAEAFEAAVGFHDPVDNSAQTSAFLQLVEKYSANLEDEKAATCRKRVVDFCIDQDKSGRAVEIAELSEQMDDVEPAAFQRYIASTAPDAPSQFYADRKQMRQFVRISGRSDELSLSFSSECLGQSIVYDPSTDSLVLKAIPPALKARLIKFVENQRDE